MKIYLAGPMSGILNFNFPLFAAAATLLRSEGHRVFCPPEHTASIYGVAWADNPTGSVPEAVEKFGLDVRRLLGDDTAWICSEAEAIAVLPGWQQSKGARAEVALARALGLRFIVVHDAYEMWYASYSTVPEV